MTFTPSRKPASATRDCPQPHISGPELVQLGRLIYKFEESIKDPAFAAPSLQKHIWVRISQCMHASGWPKRSWISLRNRGLKLLEQLNSKMDKENQFPRDLSNLAVCPPLERCPSSASDRISDLSIGKKTPTEINRSLPTPSTGTLTQLPFTSIPNLVPSKELPGPVSTIPPNDSRMVNASTTSYSNVPCNSQPQIVNSFSRAFPPIPLVPAFPPLVNMPNCPPNQFNSYSLIPNLPQDVGLGQIGMAAPSISPIHTSGASPMLSGQSHPCANNTSGIHPRCDAYAHPIHQQPNLPPNMNPFSYPSCAEEQELRLQTCRLKLETYRLKKEYWTRKLRKLTS